MNSNPINPNSPSPLSLLDDLEAYATVPGAHKSGCNPLRKFLTFLAHWHKPRLAVGAASALLVTATTWTAYGWASASPHALPPLFSTLALTLCVIGGMLLMPLLEHVSPQPIRRGMTWMNPAEIPLGLIALLITPLAVLPAGLLGACALWKIYKSSNRRNQLINLTAFVVPWMIVGELFHVFAPALSPVGQSVLFIGCAISGEFLAIAFSFSLFALAGGEVRIPHYSLQSLFPEFAGFLCLLIAALATVLDSGVIGAGVIFIGYGGLYATETTARAHLTAQGYRALSWGLAASIIHLLEHSDHRLQRHSLNVARYTRDIVQKVGLNKAIQELAFMAGLLHDLGLAGLGKRLRVTEEEFLRDDAPPEPTNPNNSGQRNDAITPEKIINYKPEHKDNQSESPLHKVDDDNGGAPSWWRPPGVSGDALNLSDEDVQALDDHPDIIAGILTSASMYGDLPKIVARHHKAPARNRHCATNTIIHALRVADRYESLTAIDGSLPPMHPENAVEFLRFYVESGDVDKTMLDAFEGVLQSRDGNYRNGTDLTYKETPADFLDDTLPSPINLWGWRKNALPSMSDYILNELTTKKRS